MTQHYDGSDFIHNSLEREGEKVSSWFSPVQKFNKLRSHKHQKQLFCHSSYRNDLVKSYLTNNFLIRQLNFSNHWQSAHRQTKRTQYLTKYSFSRNKVWHDLSCCYVAQGNREYMLETNSNLPLNESPGTFVSCYPTENWQ